MRCCVVAPEKLYFSVSQPVCHDLVQWFPHIIPHETLVDVTVFINPQLSKTRSDLEFYYAALPAYRTPFPIQTRALIKSSCCKTGLPGADGPKMPNGLFKYAKYFYQMPRKPNVVAFELTR